MRKNRVEAKDIRLVANECHVDEREARKAIYAFFGAIESYARSLPLHDSRRIYLVDAFGPLSKVWNIPYVGRIGLSYSRYLAWRRNESRQILQEPRRKYRLRIPQSEIENMAADIISGRIPAPLKKRKGNELYERIWLVGKDRKRQARQVIPKKIDNED